MGNIGVSKALRRFLQFITHTHIDPFGSSAFSTSQVVVVAVAVAQAIYLGSVLSDTSLYDLGPFELLEATISGNHITGIRR
tara:strand:+ start:143 stop:385 length:243 start_codon:yes stop_codon:yes gene_type:complete